MKRIRIRAIILILVAIYFIACSAAFIIQYAKNYKSWVTNPYNRDVYTNGWVSGGKILSSDGQLLFEANNKKISYGKTAILRKATLHTVGDQSGSINTGILKRYTTQIIGYDLVNGAINAKTGNTANLTLNAKVCTTAYNALNGRNGTIGVYNYKTGEILCMVSAPAFDPNNIPDITTSEYEGVYINRLIGGVYTPGSIFKLITAAAAIECIPDIYTRKFLCKGGTTIDGEWIKCENNHGTIDFPAALANSCNAAFAMISEELGANILTEYAAKAGIGTAFKIEGASTAIGKFKVSDKDKTALAWAGIGQHTDLVNPMQYMIYMGAIANGGKAVTPYYVKNIKTQYGLPIFSNSLKVENRMLSSVCASALADMMRNNARKSYNDSSFGDMQLCAKTGTAQLDKGKPHSWFVGFLANPNTPLAFVVVIENGGSGSSGALPVARTVLKEAVKTFD